MRTFLAALGVVLLVSLAAGGAGRGSAATSKAFSVTGGTVTVQLSGALLTAFAGDDAVLTATGGAKLTLTKTKQRLLTLPVVAGGTLLVTPASRTLEFEMRGSLVLTGSGTRAVLPKPYFLAGVGTDQFGFVLNGQRNAVVQFAKVALPGSFSGRTFSLTGLGGIVPQGVGWAFAGYSEHPGEPGNGPAPHFGSTGDVAFGTFHLKLNVRPQK